MHFHCISSLPAFISSFCNFFAISPFTHSDFSSRIFFYPFAQPFFSSTLPSIPNYPFLFPSIPFLSTPLFIPFNATMSLFHTIVRSPFIFPTYQHSEEVSRHKNGLAPITEDIQWLFIGLWRNLEPWFLSREHDFRA